MLPQRYLTHCTLLSKVQPTLFHIEEVLTESGAFRLRGTKGDISRPHEALLVAADDVMSEFGT